MQQLLIEAIIVGILTVVVGTIVGFILGSLFSIIVYGNTFYSSKFLIASSTEEDN